MRFHQNDETYHVQYQCLLLVNFTFVKVEYWIFSEFFIYGRKYSKILQECYHQLVTIWFSCQIITGNLLIFPDVPNRRDHVLIRACVSTSLKWCVFEFLLIITFYDSLTLDAKKWSNLRYCWHCTSDQSSNSSSQIHWTQQDHPPGVKLEIELTKMWIFIGLQRIMYFLLVHIRREYFWLFESYPLGPFTLSVSGSISVIASIIASVTLIYNGLIHTKHQQQHHC